MNVKEAKEQIKNAMIAYFSKDEYGDYIIPIEKQRPIFLMGPPGIGKTAIMEQVAAEMGVGILSYSMTHHTRQSALGLPFIEHKNYKGMECDVSEYTMSEIIASIYELMEQADIEEGILFLDEINCVSETLAPVMLQFLQYKIFGKHHVPKGWIIVTAGNPAEYNNSVREFDIVTWDRLKRIDVEPDYTVWREYAIQKGMHPTIMTYLEIKKSDFYNVETTVEGKAFVTARGWEDLSQMIQLYERNKLKVDEKLVVQYLQKSRIAKDFAVYYDLFQKYKEDYHIASIIEGRASKEIKERARKARFDERLSLIGLMMDFIRDDIRNVMRSLNVMRELMGVLRGLKTKFSSKSATPAEHMAEIIRNKQDMLRMGEKAGSISAERRAEQKRLMDILENERAMIESADNPKKAFEILKGDFDTKVKEQSQKAELAQKHLSNLFAFCNEAFGEGQEMLVVVTELTVDKNTSNYIAQYGCEAYFKYNKILFVRDRQQEIADELERINFQL